jgi:hypothetical protein
VGPRAVGHAAGQRSHRADPRLHHRLPPRARVDQVRRDGRRRQRAPAAPRARPDRARQRAHLPRGLLAQGGQPPSRQHVRLHGADRRLLRRRAADRLQRALALRPRHRRVAAGGDAGRDRRRDRAVHQQQRNARRRQLGRHRLRLHEGRIPAGGRHPPGRRPQAQQRDSRPERPDQRLVERCPLA